MLVKNGAIADDSFVRVTDDEPLPNRAVLVSLKRFLAERAHLLSRQEPLGVVLETAETPDALGDDVRKLAVIVLNVHYFRDGRAFSWSRLLRTRLGYAGEIRVSGHVLRDQLAFYARVGVDAFDLSQNLSVDDLQAALAEISNVYQPSVDGRETIFDFRRKTAH